jgi:excinuclease UvrABC nuclease subunit
MSSIDPKPEIQRSLTEFQMKIAYKSKLLVDGPYFPYQKFRDNSREIESCPNSDSPGVYLFCSGEGNFLYIGECLGKLGNRVWAHIGKSGEANDPYPNAKSWIKESKPDIAIYTIALPEDHWFLAPALEKYLIKTLKPENNILDR